MGGKSAALGLLVAAFLSAQWASAASLEATLVGKVSDREGQPLPGATVVLSNDTLAFTQAGTLTDARGDFRFPNLPAGSGYRLTVSLPGYSTLIFSDLALSPGRTAEQLVVL